MLLTYHSLSLLCLIKNGLNEYLRICQGRFFADATIWLTIVNVLAVFDILPSIDPMSNEEVVPKVEFLSGFTRQVASNCMTDKVLADMSHTANQNPSHVVSFHVAHSMQR